MERGARLGVGAAIGNGNGIVVVELVLRLRKGEEEDVEGGSKGGGPRLRGRYCGSVSTVITVFSILISDRMSRQVSPSLSAQCSLLNSSTYSNKTFSSLKNIRASYVLCLKVKVKDIRSQPN